MISGADYSGWGSVVGHGSPMPTSMAELEELNKALMAGNSVNDPGVTPGEGFALRTESLERTLKNQTFMAEHIRFWKQITKIPAYNTVEEYNELQQYGTGSGGFVAEGETPSEDDSTYARKTVQIKFMGTTRKVSHPMALVRPAHGDVIAQETITGTMFLLGLVERALFEADSSLSELQFDGLRKQIEDRSPSTNVVDLRGRTLDEDVLMDIALRVSDAPNYGIPTDFHLNPRAHADLCKQLFPKSRWDTFQADKNGNIGIDVAGWRSPAGPVKFQPNTFVDDGGAPQSAAGPVNATKNPGAPSISTGATTPVDGDSKFGASDAGSYYYWIVAYNDFGWSAPVAVDAGALAPAAGDSVTFGVTPAGGNATKWYQLYRTKIGASGIGNARLIARIPNTEGSGELTVTDLNAKLPYTTEGYLIQQNLNCLSWKQLAPFVKIPLSTDSPSYRWMQLLYGALTLYAPKKVLLVKNIGRTEGAIT